MKYIRIIVISIVVLLGIAAIYYTKTYNGFEASILLLQQNIWYMLYAIGTISLIYPLSIGTQKREKYLMSVLLISHGIIISTYFLTTQFELAIPMVCFMIVLFILLILAIHIHHRSRVCIIVPLSILFVSVAILTIMPKYHTIPTEQDFYDAIGVTLYVVVNDVPVTLREVQADIVVKSIYTGQELKISVDETSPQIRTYPIKRPATIYFDSSQALYNTFVFLQFYDGEVYPIPTQSSLTIQYTQSGYATSTTGINQEKTINDAQSFISDQTGKLYEQYSSQRRLFFIDRIGGIWTQNIYIDRGLGYVLLFLDKTFPAYYSQNYINYKKFKLLIGSEDKGGTDRDELFQDQNASFRENVAPGIQRSRLFKGLISE